MQILNKMHLDNGNLLITCKARARMQVADPQRDLLGYWTAQAEMLPMSPFGPGAHQQITESAMDQCRRVYQDFLALQVLGHTEEEQSDILGIMNANVRISFLCVDVLLRAAISLSGPPPPFFSYPSAVSHRLNSVVGWMWLPLLAWDTFL